jgi:hypothetical protein
MIELLVFSVFGHGLFLLVNGIWVWGNCCSHSPGPVTCSPPPPTPDRAIGSSDRLHLTHNSPTLEELTRYPSHLSNKIFTGTLHHFIIVFQGLWPSHRILFVVAPLTAIPGIGNPISGPWPTLSLNHEPSGSPISTATRQSPMLDQSTRPTGPCSTLCW